MPTERPPSAAGSGLLASIRRNPSLASELLTLHALTIAAPALPPTRVPRPSPDVAAQRSIRRAARRARRDGAVTGTAFVVAYPAALASLYLTQILMVLEIAAAHGHDPAEPRRAAELLVLRGRHATVDAAASALADARAARARARPTARNRRSLPLLAEYLRAAVGRLRAAVGRLRAAVGRLRGTPALDVILGVTSVASFVVPFVGVPACSYGAARATRRLGRRATAYYAATSGPPMEAVDFSLPAPPSVRAGLAACAAVLGTILFGLALSVVWVGGGHHGAWRVALAVLWVFVLTAHVRLGRLLLPIIRPGRLPVAGTAAAAEVP